jgi:hypothetical protein
VTKDVQGHVRHRCSASAIKNICRTMAEYRALAGRVADVSAQDKHTFADPT